MVLQKLTDAQREVLETIELGYKKNPSRELLIKYINALVELNVNVVIDTPAAISWDVKVCSDINGTAFETNVGVYNYDDIDFINFPLRRFVFKK